MEKFVTEIRKTSQIYTDRRRGAKESDLMPGDLVLMKQKKENEFSAPFENVPYEMIQKEGNRVVNLQNKRHWNK